MKATNVFPKHILKSKASDQLIQTKKLIQTIVLARDSKELFVQRFV